MYGTRVSKHRTPGTGWTTRQESGAWALVSGAAGGGAEGQDLPSQFSLWNPAPPGRGSLQPGEVSHRTSRETGIASRAGTGPAPSLKGVEAVLGLLEPRGVRVRPGLRLANCSWEFAKVKSLWGTNARGKAGLQGPRSGKGAELPGNGGGKGSA